VQRSDAGPVRHAQVRRSSYFDVVRAQDIAKLTDVSGVQAYTINGARYRPAFGLEADVRPALQAALLPLGQRCGQRSHGGS
jgi:hypothetical protein